MRVITTFGRLCLLVCGSYLFGQPIWPTNTLGQTQAIKIAGRRKTGMREEDAVQLLSVVSGIDVYEERDADSYAGWSAAK